VCASVKSMLLKAININHGSVNVFNNKGTEIFIQETTHRGWVRQGYMRIRYIKRDTMLKTSTPIF
jgi:hypothetical protein